MIAAFIIAAIAGLAVICIAPVADLLSRVFAPESSADDEFEADASEERRFREWEGRE